MKTLVLRRRRTGSVAVAVAVASAAVAGGLAPTGAGASIIGACGPVERSAVAPDLRPGAAESSTTVRAVEESSGRALEAPMSVDIAAQGTYETEADLARPRPTVASGTVVDSYLVHSDPVGQVPGTQKRITVTLTFPADVRGIIVSNVLLDASDGVVGAPTTVYPTGNPDRGLELAPRVDFVQFTDPRTVTLTVLTTTVVDQIRIITAAVPEQLKGGYRLVASDGGVFSFGAAEFHGSTGNIKLNRPIVGAAGTCSSRGYWLVASDGGIFAFGDARFLGSTGALRLNRPVVGMAPTPSDGGYWLVASDGGIFAFGDARFLGSAGAIKLNQPVVGMAPTPSGEGYWLVASDGGIFAFGDARFLGSTGAIKLNRPVVGMAATPSGEGYWLVASDGGIFAFGDARFLGSTGAIKLNQPIVGMVPTSSGEGYRMVASDGGVFAFGDARFFGSTGAIKLNKPMVALF